MKTLAERMHDAGVEFVEVAGSHRLVTGRAHVSLLLAKTQADLERFKTYAAANEVTFDEAGVRVATQKETSRWDDVAW